MSEQNVLRLALDLVWSLWTELGVPGVLRHHKELAIDPEPLILFTPALASADPRLEELVSSWCVQHAGHISKTRLDGLFHRAPETIQQEFAKLSGALHAQAGVRWPPDERSQSQGAEWEQRLVSLPMERPALVRFRMRALCGVGARADVLCELLAREGKWTRAAELAAEGYTKRSVARTLAELAAGGIAVSREEGNSRSFRLSKPEALSALLLKRPQIWPQWFSVLHLTWSLVELAGMSSRKSGVRRVEASKWRGRLEEEIARLWLPALPATSGNPNAFEDVLEWGESQLAEFAAGKLVVK